MASLSAAEAHGRSRSRTPPTDVEENADPVSSRDPWRASDPPAAAGSAGVARTDIEALLAKATTQMQQAGTATMSKLLSDYDAGVQERFKHNEAAIKDLSDQMVALEQRAPRVDHALADVRSAVAVAASTVQPPRVHDGSFTREIDTTLLRISCPLAIAADKVKAGLDA